MSMIRSLVFSFSGQGDDHDDPFNFNFNLFSFLITPINLPCLFELCRA